MKDKIHNLEDIRREKQKLKLEIGIHEYALSLNFKQIKHKLTLGSFSAYIFDLARERVKASIPSFFIGLLSGFWKAFRRKKHKR